MSEEKAQEDFGEEREETASFQPQVYPEEGTAERETSSDFSCAAIALLRGVVFRAGQEALWQTILKRRAHLSDYFAVIGLQLYIDALDEYAYLRQNEDSGLPRLISRQPLGYHLSMLLVYLRKRLGEFNASCGDARLVVKREDILAAMRTYHPPVTNEAGFEKRVDRYIAQAVEMGFLQSAEGQAAYFVRPLLRSFVSGEWMRDFDANRRAYEDYGKGNAGEAEQLMLEEEE